MTTTPTTNAERCQRRRERMSRAGFRDISVVAHQDDVDAVRKYAAELAKKRVREHG